ncbi:MucR family transcriptional regulator [Mesorhizobium sp. CA6]|uniref:MucR family transcriptional regulator n=1 Tax=Mesorhizobium sp. CA6 TaxID=588500 RepID=UPI0029620F8F|nr:MucR family transcriptional regulator [Mesorhizobium sp. CA6]
MYPDYIVCLEDGKKFKSLKRHLGVKWALKPDHPMVAPNYAAQRSVLGKSSGLGRKTVVACKEISTSEGLISLSQSEPV